MQYWTELTAVMLSAETSVGKHPVKVVEAMNKIIQEAEMHYTPSVQFAKPSPKSAPIGPIWSAIMQPAWPRMSKQKRLSV
jgi:pyruvate kinase